MHSSSPDVLIVSFESEAHLPSSLSSVLDCAPHSRTVVVDNSSHDGSDRVAEGFGGNVSVYRNTENVGFARAVNQGVRHTGTETVLLLNPDCRLLPGAIEALLAELAAHPECAIAGPQVLDTDGSVQGSARGDPTILTGLFGRTSLLTRLFPSAGITRRNVRTETGADSNRNALETDWVSGACMLIRRNAFDRVSGFDERYFLYWEDADLCRRLRQAGYTIRYVPRARVFHEVGRSSRSAQTLSIRAFHDSAYLYYATHVGRSRMSRTLAWILLEGRCRWKLLRSAAGRVLGLRDSPLR